MLLCKKIAAYYLVTEGNPSRCPKTKTLFTSALALQNPWRVSENISLGGACGVLSWSTETRVVPIRCSGQNWYQPILKLQYRYRIMIAKNWIGTSLIGAGQCRLVLETEYTQDASMHNLNRIVWEPILHTVPFNSSSMLSPPSYNEHFSFKTGKLHFTYQHGSQSTNHISTW